MTDMTMPIMNCKRRMFLASCSLSFGAADRSAPSRAFIFVPQPDRSQPNSAPLLQLDEARQPNVALASDWLILSALAAERNFPECRTSVTGGRGVTIIGLQSRSQSGT